VKRRLFARSGFLAAVALTLLVFPPASADRPAGGRSAWSAWPRVYTSSPPPQGQTAGRALAFSEEFDGPLDIPGTWGWKTGAYEFGDRNPNHYKRDRLTKDSLTVAAGALTITATRRDDFYWNTGLLTTGDSWGSGGNGFTVRAGDFLVNRVKLPTGNLGAWPALWTWLDGGTEIDVFEWHSDNPNLLEFANHIRGGGYYHTDAGVVAPGKWVWIGCELGSTNNTWYVGETLQDMRPVWSDGTGIGNARPHIIVNLSVGASEWHASPAGDEPIVYQVDNVRVYR